MSIILHGSSRCEVCGNIIEAGQDVIGFPAFIANRHDPIYRFNDTAVHVQRCSLDPIAAKAAEMVGAWYLMAGLTGRIDLGNAPRRWGVHRNLLAMRVATLNTGASRRTLRDFYRLSPQRRNKLLALSVYQLRGAGDRTNSLVDRVRATFTS